MIKRILVVGCGSIGERHVRCFLRTGRVRVAACDINADLLKKVAGEYQVSAFPDVKEALAAERFDGVVVCTPAHTHIEFALLALHAGAAVLIEKPLSTSLSGVSELKAEAARLKQFVAVAYVLHFAPSLAGAREFLRQGALGKPLQASVVAGQHFPTFRPAYREIYYNRHDTGGGAIQDAFTHLANAVEWLIGRTENVFCHAAHLALDGVSVEDTVSVTARNGTALVSYSMNQFQAPNETTLQIHCERGSVKIELHEQRWGVFRHGAENWENHAAPVTHRDDLFVAQAEAFLDGMDGKPNPLCTLDDAVQTLRVNLAALESARGGQLITLPT